MPNGKAGFLREATGLVRELTFFDFVAMNFGAAAITAGLLTANYSAWLFPHGSIPWGIILTGLLMMGT